jgi:hypothetical protein
MADVKDSRQINGEQLMQELSNLVEATSNTHRNSFLSPITITLGDEFQSILKSVEDAIDVLFNIEESRFKLKTNFSFRYVLYYGKIDTQINKKIAYGMLGSGLTESREILNKQKKGASRFFFDLKNEKSELLNGLFFLYSSIVDKWKFTDYELIDQFLQVEDYKIVADQLKKNRGYIWRREKSLEIPQYLILKKLIKRIIK